MKLSIENTPQYIYGLIPTHSPAGDSENCLVIDYVVCGSKYYGEFTLSDSFVNYVLDNAICSRCVEIIGEATHLSTCEKPVKTDSFWSSPRNRRCYLPPARVSEFKKMWELERRRWQKFSREYKLQKISLPANGILLQLIEQQENRCYYCFNQFETNSSNLKPHLDHFVSVANGGSNSIFNLVYACARCNKEKFTENGEQYIDKGLPTALFPSDVRSNIHKMREAVGEWKEQFKPEYLSHVEGLRKKHHRKMPDTKTPEFSKWLDEEYKLLLRLGCIRGEIR